MPVSLPTLAGLWSCPADPTMSSSASPTEPAAFIASAAWEGGAASMSSLQPDSEEGLPGWLGPAASLSELVGKHHPERSSPRAGLHACLLPKTSCGVAGSSWCVHLSSRPTLSPEDACQLCLCVVSDCFMNEPFSSSDQGRQRTSFATASSAFSSCHAELSPCLRYRHLAVAVRPELLHNRDTLRQTW